MNRRQFLLTTGIISGGLIPQLTRFGNNEKVVSTPVVGSKNAANTIMIFDDLMCPYSRNFYLGIYPKFKNKIDRNIVKFEFYERPTPENEDWSTELANMAKSIKDMHGTEKYIYFKKEIYKNQLQITEYKIKQILERLDIHNKSEIITIGYEKEYQESVDEDLRKANIKNVNSLPSIFVNNKQRASSYEIISNDLSV